MKRVIASLVALLVLNGVASAQFVDQRTWGGTSGGSANAQTISIANYTTYTVGVTLRYVAGFTNTGPQTLNISTLGTRNVYKPTAAGAAPLSGGEVIAGQLVEVTYDGAQFQLVSSAALPSQVAPQGYLTPCPFAGGVTGCTAGSVLPTGDVSGVSVLYYTPIVGYLVPVYNGSTFVTYTFSELTLTIPASRLANTIYDVCVTTTSGGAFLNNGTPTLVFGPAWTNSASGTSSRGTGAGTAELTKVNGLLVNANQISAVNGATTYTVPTSQCTFVASVQIGTSNGVVTYHVTYGQNRKWAGWNHYNRQQIALKAGDATASWPYNSGTIRASNGSSSNKLTVFSGWPDEPYHVTFTQRMTIGFTVASTGNTTGTMFNLIGWNSIVAGFGTQGSAMVQLGNSTTGSISISSGNTGTATYDAPPVLGIVDVSALESGSTAGGSTYFGTELNMSLRAYWRG